MALDPTKHADWEIAQDAEKDMLTIYEIGEKLGLAKEELLPQGHYIGKPREALMNIPRSASVTPLHKVSSAD